MAIVRNLRHRRSVARANRAIDEAIRNAATPGMRDELIVVAQRNEVVDDWTLAR